MPAAPNELKFDSKDALATRLAVTVSGLLSNAIETRGSASLVVSGGRTPAPFLSALSEQKLDWSKVSVTLADERWVDVAGADSNESLVRGALLQNAASKARFIGLKNSAATPSQGESECEAALAAMPELFDVVVLGLGDDAHTASLFPLSPQLADALNMNSGRRCIAMEAPTAPQARMSLTLPALLASRQIIVVFTGANKYEVYRKALEPGPIAVMPIRSILQQMRAPVDVYWSISA